MFYTFWRRSYILKKSLQANWLKNRVHKTTQDRIKNRNDREIENEKARADVRPSVSTHMSVSTGRNTMEMVNYFYDWGLLVIKEFPSCLSCALEGWYERHPFIWPHKWSWSFNSSWLIMLHYFMWKMLSIKATVRGGLMRHALLESTMELYS